MPNVLRNHAVGPFGELWDGTKRSINGSQSDVIMGLMDGVALAIFLAKELPA